MSPRRLSWSRLPRLQCRGDGGETPGRASPRACASGNEWAPGSGRGGKPGHVGGGRRWGYRSTPWNLEVTEGPTVRSQPRPTRAGPFLGRRSAPVQSAQSFAHQLLQRAQRRCGARARLCERQGGGSSRAPARAQDVCDTEGGPGCPRLRCRAHHRQPDCEGPAARRAPLRSAPELPRGSRAGPPSLGPAPHGGIQARWAPPPAHPRPQATRGPERTARGLRLRRRAAGHGSLHIRVCTSRDPQVVCLASARLVKSLAINLLALAPRAAGELYMFEPN